MDVLDAFERTVAGFLETMYDHAECAHCDYRRREHGWRVTVEWMLLRPDEQIEWLDAHGHDRFTQTVLEVLELSVDAGRSVGGGRPAAVASALEVLERHAASQR